MQAFNVTESRTSGAFLAVVFVDSVDVIARDREELGIPEVFCDFHTHREESTHILKASWHGIGFAEMRLYDVEQTDVEAQAKATGSE